MKTIFNPDWIRCSCALLVAGSLALMSWAAEPPSTKKQALELTLETPKSVFTSREGVSFVISFHNTNTDRTNSANNLLLNGGELLGNGAQIWSSLEIELKSEAGQHIPTTLGWGFPPVGGRIYFLGVPLPAGGSFKLPVLANDCIIGTGERLKPGKYEMSCVYHGRQSPDRDSTQLPPCWEGEVRSTTFKFEVLAE